MKTNILHLSTTDLGTKLEELGLKKFTLKQIQQWFYDKGIFDFAKMSNISKANQELLTKNFSIKLPEISKDVIAQDETRKWLFRFDDFREVETVFIPEEKRGTLCISSQVGCTLSCTFCHTGTQTWVRNLEFHEIIGQILLAKNLLKNYQSKFSYKNEITNIVFMGMGEPFFNYDNVKKSVEILTNKNGLNFSPKKITISTSGLCNEIKKAATELKTSLAISLHGTNDKLRTNIMAINKKYPLSELFLACKYYNQENPKEKITFEYVMLDNINDSANNAKELIKLINKYNLNAKINLIPFNSWEGCDYQDSALEKTKIFQQILKESGLIATIRKTRGDDAMAACGQLKSLSQRVKSKKV